MTNQAAKIEKFINAFGQVRYRIDFGPSAYTGKAHNYSLKVWETRSGALKALQRRFV